MKRLTTNKDVSEMSMTELMFNSCYVKDYWVRYRDYERDIDAREFAKQLLEKFTGKVYSFESDEDFDEYILDCLQDGADSIEGLIALFYWNMVSMAELREKLKSYEDLDEQGLLLRLPCEIGTHLWRVTKPYRQEPKVTEYVVKNFRTTGKKHRLQLEVQALSVPLTNWMSYSEFFVTRAEAEKALADMKRK